MSKQEQLCGLYRSLLQSLDLHVEADDAIVFQPPGALGKDGEPMKLPAIVENKQWVLPTKRILQSSPWDECIAFHPLSENILNTYSATINKLKAVINYKLNAVLGQVLAALTEFAADTGRHGTVSAKAGKFLKLVPDVSETSAKRMHEIVKRAELSDSNRRLINVFLKKRGELDGRIYLKAAMINFPFRDELNGAEPKVFGVTISKKDQASFKALFDYVLPDNEQLEGYSVGSDSHTAPNFEALVGAFIKVASRLNEVISTHRKVMPSYQELMIDLDWADQMDDLEKLSVAIPPLPGNVGEPVRAAGAKAVAEAAAPSKRVKQLFDAEVKASAPKERVPANPLAGERGERSLSEAEAQRAEEASSRRDVSELSFTERVELQKRGVRPGFARTGEREVRDIGLGRRSYATKREDTVPDWAENPSGSRFVVGDDPSKPKPRDPLGGSDRRGMGGSSFSDRMAARGLSDYDDRGSRLGGGFGSRGSRFRSL